MTEGQYQCGKQNDLRSGPAESRASMHPATPR